MAGGGLSQKTVLEALKLVHTEHYGGRPTGAAPRQQAQVRAQVRAQTEFLQLFDSVEEEAHKLRNALHRWDRGAWSGKWVYDLLLSAEHSVLERPAELCLGTGPCALARLLGKRRSAPGAQGMVPLSLLCRLRFQRKAWEVKEDLTKALPHLEALYARFRQLMPPGWLSPVVGSESLLAQNMRELLELLTVSFRHIANVRKLLWEDAAFWRDDEDDEL